MKVAPGWLIEQREQRALEGLHLLLGLCAGARRIWGEQGSQPSNLGREPVILSREDRDLLLGNAGFCQSLVSLLLAKVCPVAPQTGRGTLSRIIHADTCSHSRAPLPQPLTALRGSQADLRHGRWPAPSDAELQPVPQVRTAFSVLPAQDQGCYAVGYGKAGKGLSG
jgi:hypothetical protein